MAKALDGSWAREDLIPPYYIYLKIAYHLSQEARVGLSEYKIPRDIGDRIGQTAETILCYSFLPVEGVERIIRLRGRLSQRLKSAPQKS